MATWMVKRIWKREPYIAGYVTLIPRSALPFFLSVFPKKQQNSPCTLKVPCPFGKQKKKITFWVRIQFLPLKLVSQEALYTNSGSKVWTNSRTRFVFLLFLLLTFNGTSSGAPALCECSVVPRWFCSQEAPCVCGSQCKSEGASGQACSPGGGFPGPLSVTRTAD